MSSSSDGSRARSRRADCSKLTELDELAIVMYWPPTGYSGFMRATVSFLETAVFCDHDGHTPREVFAHSKQSGSTYHRSSDSQNQGAH